MASLLFFTLLWNLLAPLPPQIAINPETKECGNFWGGDEYVDYHLPPPWKIISYGTPVQIETRVYEWNGSISSAGVESFCNQIGYTYVSGNLGQERGERRWSPYTYTLVAVKIAPLIIGLIIVFIALLIYLRWKNKRSKNAPVS